MSRRTLLVAWREYQENLKTKAFWLGILFLPVLLTLGMLVPTLLEKTKDTRVYAVVDRSGWLLEAVDQRVTAYDLGKVLRTALEARRAGDDDFTGLPAVVREAAEGVVAVAEASGGPAAVEGAGEAGGVTAVEEAAIQRFAAAVAGVEEAMPAVDEAGEAGAGLDPASMDRLLEQADEVRRWWWALGPDEAGDLGVSTNRSRFVRTEVSGAGEGVRENLNRRIADDDLFAYFVIGEDPVASHEGFTYVSSNLTDEDLRDWFAYHAGAEIRKRRLASREIDEESARWIQQPLRFELKKIGKGGVEEEVSTADQVRQWAPVAFVYLLWIAIFGISQGLLTSTVEEKSNRIIEVLLSSVSPIELMAGKIAGIAATGLTMVGSWVIFFLLIVNYLPGLLGASIDFDLSAIVRDPVYLTSFLIYFILGYLFFSAFLVAIGSACNSLKEAQNLMMPVTLLLIVPLFSMVPISRDPNGTLAKVLSYVPPFTPFVMMNRAAGPPSLLEYVATSVLLLVSIFLVLWGAAKVFRVGILMTGKPPTPAEIFRWLRAPVGQIPTRK